MGGGGGGRRGQEESAAGDSATWSEHAREALRDLVLHPDVLVGAAERHLARAALLLGAADALLESAGAGWPPAERARLGTRLSFLRSGLTGAAWAPMWAEGRVLALNLLPPPAPGPPPAPDPLVSPSSGDPAVPLPPEVLRGSLTRREREVLRLVADGLSNEQIAGILVTGKRTVESHLAHIGSKLRLRRRAVIAHAREILGALAPGSGDPA